MLRAFREIVEQADLVAIGTGVDRSPDHLLAIGQQLGGDSLPLGVVFPVAAACPAI
ncbi:hypothetical protein [Mycolicibacterium iranicum]|uniref:Uncharacterized protein n=1 Tax=Mycolicibacterium iranicum TaxID=912594 RepID=A0ABT4HQ47_MYCIR|nr:hypothetical protein [Mycolicibacterium iranicum]MCZ0732323.1 hypothetical protein [Mycolicibacterium iranicum]